MNLENLAHDTMTTITDHPQFGLCLLGKDGYIYARGDHFYFKRHDKQWVKEFSPTNNLEVATAARLIDIAFRNRGPLDRFARTHGLKVTVTDRGCIIRGRDGMIFTNSRGNSFYWMLYSGAYPNTFTPTNPSHLRVITAALGIKFKRQRLATVKRLDRTTEAA